jgi:hypothetical protein
MYGAKVKKMVPRVFFTVGPKPSTSRKRSREEVERDLQVLGVRKWRELVIDRGKWRGIVRQAKAHSGL